MICSFLDENSSLILELAGLIKFTRPFLGSVSKAKAAKLVRGLVDMFLDMEASTGKEVGGRKLSLCWPTIHLSDCKLLTLSIFSVEPICQMSIFIGLILVSNIDGLKMKHNLSYVRTINTFMYSYIWLSNTCMYLVIFKLKTSAT